MTRQLTSITYLPIKEFTKLRDELYPDLLAHSLRGKRSRLSIHQLEHRGTTYRIRLTSLQWPDTIAREYQKLDKDISQP